MLSVAPCSLQSLFPCWYGEVPKIGDKKIEGDWIHVSLRKRASDGSLLPKLYEYHMEKSTGDLYGIKSRGRIDTPSDISLKAVGLIPYTFVYAPAIILSNVVKIAIDISKIFWKIIPEHARQFEVKGVMRTLGNITFSILTEVPMAIAEDTSRMFRAVVYAPIFITACLYTTLQPLEGRKLISKVELFWRQVDSYRSDFRYEVPSSKKKERPSVHWAKEIAAGKIQFAAYCMLKRGNIDEVVATGERRFSYA